MTTKKSTTTKRTTSSTRKTTSRRKKKGETLTWKKIINVTPLKRWFTKKTGIPLTKAGWERKIGKFFIDLFLGGKDKNKAKEEKNAPNKLLDSQEDRAPASSGAEEIGTKE